MGYKHAVALSQRTLQVCILEAMETSGLSTNEVDGEVWVDNVILVATTPEFLELFVEHFYAACERINLNCLPECEAGPVVTWVGLEIDLVASTYQLTDKWCQKVRPLLDLVSWHALTDTPLLSAVYQKFVGVCTYACYIQRQPMLIMSPLFTPLVCDPKAMVSLSKVAAYMNAPYQLLSLGPLALAPPVLHTRKAGQPMLFTDASGYAAGYHVEHGDVSPPWQDRIHSGLPWRRRNSTLRPRSC